MGCGLEPGGVNAGRHGVCPAAAQNMGHSCWAVAGTFCQGVVQGDYARKLQTCVACPVYRRYNRVSGTHGQDVARAYTEEQARYLDLILAATHRGDPRK